MGRPIFIPLAIANHDLARIRMVQPFGFVNWRSINRYFCAMMWMVVFVLALVVFTHLVHTGTGAHASAVVLSR